MNMSKIRALIKKEWIDFSRNSNVSIISMLPLLLIIIFGTISKDNPDFPLSGYTLLSLGINMNLVFVSTFAMSMMIAEEKEKQTLRTLMLATVKPLEFIISKAVIIFTLSIFTNAAMYFFTGLKVDYFFIYFIISIPLALIMMLIGACIGMIAKSQMSTSIYGMPVIMVFMLLPLFGSMNKVMEKIVGILPNQIILYLLEQKSLGILNTFPFFEVIILITWIVLTLLLFVYTFNKTKVDY